MRRLHALALLTILSSSALAEGSFVGRTRFDLDRPEIRAFVETLDKRLPVRHAIQVAIVRALTEAGIEIPFPQRDLHIRSADGLAGFLARSGAGGG